MLITVINDVLLEFYYHWMISAFQFVGFINDNAE